MPIYALILMSQANLHGLCRTKSTAFAVNLVGEWGQGKEQRAPMPFALCHAVFCYAPPVVRVPLLKSDTPGRFEKSAAVPLPPVVWPAADCLADSNASLPRSTA